MFAHITTDAITKRIELAIVDIKGDIIKDKDGRLYSKPIANFDQVAIAYRAYRHEYDMTMPRFVDIEPKLRRQWENLNRPSLAERAKQVKAA